jgi:hypothetical protein
MSEKSEFLALKMEIVGPVEPPGTGQHCANPTEAD